MRSRTKFLNRPGLLWSACLLVAMVGATFSMQSCKDCSLVGQPQLVVGFYRYDSLAVGGEKTALDTQYVAVRGLGVDSALAITEEGTYFLPLNPLVDSSQFIFEGGGGSDTLVLRYLVENHVEGLDCGVADYFQELRVARSTFDSAIVVETSVESVSELHIEIYESNP